MTATNRLGWVAAATAMVVAVIAMLGIGWLLGSGNAPSSATPSSGPSSDAPSGSPTATPGGTPASEAPDQDDPQQGGPGGAGSGEGDPGEQRGPQVEVFRVAQEPSCPGGTTQHPIDGTPVTLQWQVTGAEEVTLSIDGPGIYDTYPAESSATIGFPCSGQEGDTQEHTYLLTAVGDGVTRTAELVVAATVHEVTTVP